MSDSKPDASSRSINSNDKASCNPDEDLDRQSGTPEVDDLLAALFVRIRDGGDAQAFAIQGILKDKIQSDIEGDLTRSFHGLIDKVEQRLGDQLTSIAADNKKYTDRYFSDFILKNFKKLKWPTLASFVLVLLGFLSYLGVSLSSHFHHGEIAESLLDKIANREGDSKLVKQIKSVESKLDKIEEKLVLGNRTVEELGKNNQELDMVLTSYKATLETALTKKDDLDQKIVKLDSDAKQFETDFTSLSEKISNLVADYEKLNTDSEVIAHLQSRADQMTIKEQSNLIYRIFSVVSVDTAHLSKRACDNGFKQAGALDITVSQNSDGETNLKIDRRLKICVKRGSKFVTIQVVARTGQTLCFVMQDQVSG